MVSALINIKAITTIIALLFAIKPVCRDTSVRIKIHLVIASFLNNKLQYNIAPVNGLFTGS